MSNETQTDHRQRWETIKSALENTAETLDRLVRDTRTQAIRDCIVRLEETSRFGSSETVLAKEACCYALRALLADDAKEPAND